MTLKVIQYEMWRKLTPGVPFSYLTGERKKGFRFSSGFCNWLQSMRKKNKNENRKKPRTLNS